MDPLKEFSRLVVKSGLHFPSHIWESIFSFSVEGMWEKRTPCRNAEEKWCKGGRYENPRGECVTRYSKTALSDKLLEEMVVVREIGGRTNLKPIGFGCYFKKFGSVGEKCMKVKTLSTAGFSSREIKGLCSNCLKRLVESSLKGSRVVRLPNSKFRKLQYLEELEKLQGSMLWEDELQELSMTVGLLAN